MFYVERRSTESSVLAETNSEPEEIPILNAMFRNLTEEQIRELKYQEDVRRVLRLIEKMMWPLKRGLNTNFHALRIG